MLLAAAQVAGLWRGGAAEAASHPVRCQCWVTTHSKNSFLLGRSVWSRLRRCRASSPLMLLLLLVVRSGAVVRRGCWRRALLPTMSIWKADVAAEVGRVRGLPVAASACPPHRLNASPHALSLHLVPHHIGAHAAM